MMKLLVISTLQVAVLGGWGWKGWGGWGGKKDPCKCPVQRVRDKYSCDFAGECVDKPDNSCLKEKAGWQGYTCSYASDWCDSRNWGADARDCCPKTCGVCSTSASKPVATRSIVENALATKELSTLVSVVTDSRYADILSALQGPGPLTVFAPTDAAFAAAGVDINQVATVKEVLLYHVLSGAIYAGDLSSYQNPRTAEGSLLTVTKMGGRVEVNDARVVVADVASTNGVVHVINSVLMPPIVSKALAGSSCADAPDKTCLYSKKGWKGYTCSYASDWCDSRNWGADARDCCPKTCGVCPAPATLRSVVEQADDRSLSIRSTATSAKTCEDKPDNTCLNKKPGWVGYTCAYASDWCDSMRYGSAARECCPKTCGTC